MKVLREKFLILNCHTKLFTDEKSFVIKTFHELNCEDLLYIRIEFVVQLA